MFNPASEQKRLRQLLLGDVIPFWMRHAVDADGGINSCIGDDGTVHSRDKWLWSQWRAVWVFATLCEVYGPHDAWLRVAQDTANFCLQHGWLEGEGWALVLSHDGAIRRGHESIYTDAFAIYGLTALARQTGDDRLIHWAQCTADVAIPQLDRQDVPHFPYPVPSGAKPHGIPMMFSLVLWELGQHLDADRYRSLALTMSDEVFEDFYRPEHDLIVERVRRSDGTPLPAPAGTAVVPGHVIENMWFQIHIARDRGDRSRIDQSIRLLRRHVEVGWDDEYGGLRLAIDAEGNPDVGWQHADTKIWWPQTEAMYALLLAHVLCRESWCLTWYQRIREYAFEHYPVPLHGEWRQKLNRHGQPLTDTIALPVKDPFHLPRALIYCDRVLDGLVPDH